MLIPFHPEFAELIWEWQLDPSYARFFRTLDRYLSLSELENFPQVCGSEILMFRDDSKILGLVSLTYLPHGVAEVGLLIDKNQQNQGHAAKMATQACAYLKNNRNLRKAICKVVGDDERTLKGALANGFEIEGTLKKQTFLLGQFEDEIVLGKFL